MESSSVMHPILMNGQWCASMATARFQAYNPASGSKLPDSFPVSPWEGLANLIKHGHRAARKMAGIPPDSIADFLESYADGIESNAGCLVETAHLETALPKALRLAEVELPRTTTQLRLASAAVRDGSWRRPVRDEKNNIHSVHGPLAGPVVVYGPNNFPFAYNGISGGDFAAAIAAGNPVIAKAHPAHPLTTKLLAEIALEALQASGLPVATVQLFYHTEVENGLSLVSHPLVAATGFTGSRRAGLALKKAADEAGKPIFLEMSSINPVILLPGALRESMQEIAGQLHLSCTLGTGQFCTKPGLTILLKNDMTECFVNTLTGMFQSTEPGILLGNHGAANIAKALATLTAHGAKILCGGKETEGPAFSFEPTLLRVSGAEFLRNPVLIQTEAFGPVALLVIADDLAQATECLSLLEGNLTGSIYSAKDGTDDDAYQQVDPILRPKVGRLLNDKMPTGVAVSPAMNHGGPYPATGHPCFSAVGVPVSLIRFTALHCYDNVRPDRLPEILRPS